VRPMEGYVLRYEGWKEGLHLNTQIPHHVGMQKQDSKVEPFLSHSLLLGLLFV
jgi:hypothetical protein